MTAAIADHEFDVYDSSRTCPNGHVQVDHHAAGAVRSDLIGAGFPPWRREVGSRVVVALVITLREVAMAVEHLDAVDNPRRTIRKTRRGVVGYAERVFALERCVRAPEIVASACPGDTTQRRHSDHGCRHSLPKPAFHVGPPLRLGRAWAAW